MEKEFRINDFKIGDTVLFYHMTLKKVFRGTILKRDPDYRWKIIDIKPRNTWTDFVYAVDYNVLYSRIVLFEKVIKNLT